jgi:Tfp pilus assembly protein PilF
MALKLEADNTDAIVCLARVYEKQNSNPLAMETYEKAVSIPNCTNVNAHFYYGVLSEKLKE